MSHVSTVSTTIKDLTILKQALKELGYGFYEGQKLEGNYVNGQTVDLLIEDKSNRYGSKSVGLVKKGDTYSFHGDVSGMKNLAKEKIVQKYTSLKLRSELKKMGAMSFTEVEQEDGAIKLVANMI